jgi:hypothetical protein
MRRCGIAALELGDIDDTLGGIAVRIRESKTDQEKVGAVVMNSAASAILLNGTPF